MNDLTFSGYSSRYHQDAKVSVSEARAVTDPDGLFLNIETTEGDFSHAWISADDGLRLARSLGEHYGLIERQEATLEEGDPAIVTGDSNGWGHEFATGQAVRVLEVDSSDRTYLVRGAFRDGLTNWIGWDDVAPAIDLTPESEGEIFDAEALDEPMAVWESELLRSLRPVSPRPVPPGSRVLVRTASFIGFAPDDPRPATVRDDQDQEGRLRVDLDKPWSSSPVACRTIYADEWTAYEPLAVMDTAPVGARVVVLDTRGDADASYGALGTVTHSTPARSRDAFAILFVRQDDGTEVAMGAHRFGLVR